MRNASASKRPLPTFPDFLQVLRFRKCPSTNDYVKKNQRRLQPRFPLLVLSEAQTAGRGRGQRHWFSGRGLGVYATFAFHPRQKEQLQWLALTAGVATADMLAELSGLEFDLKWPNDVYLQGKKIAGILIENIVREPQPLSIVGIGVNVRHRSSDFPSALQPRATSLTLACGRDVSVEAASQSLARWFFHWLKRLEEEGSAEIVARANTLSRVWLGKAVTFQEPGRTGQGIFAGIADNGGLRLQLSDGSQVVLLNGELVV